MDASPLRTRALAGRRIAAWCVDWLIISVYAVALIPLGLLIFARTGGLPPAVGNAAGFAVLVLPATIWMAAWEQGTHGGSPGKRLLRLRVLATSGARLGWRRSITRNVVKIALPWELGHTAAFTLADPAASASAATIALACSFAACLVVCVYLVSLFIGRTPYDRLSVSEVTLSSARLAAPEEG